MKIKCPECGQHYEVDANALDRHFRCTECKTLFLGLNAKAVKVQKFVPKDSAAMQEEQTDNAEAKSEDADAAAGADPGKVAVGSTEIKVVPAVNAVAVAVPKAAGEEKKSEAQMQDAVAVSLPKAEESAADVVKITREQTSELPVLSTVVVVNRILSVAAGILVVVALILIWGQKSRLDKLQKEKSKLERIQSDLIRKVENLMPLADKFNQCNAELEALRSRLKEHNEDMRLVREDAVNQLKKQSEKIAAGEEKIKNLTEEAEALEEKVEELSSRRSKNKKTSKP